MNLYKSKTSIVKYQALERKLEEMTLNYNKELLNKTSKTVKMTNVNMTNVNINIPDSNVVSSIINNIDELKKLVLETTQNLK